MVNLLCYVCIVCEYVCVCEGIFNIRLRYEDMYFWMSNKIKMFEEGCNF